MLKIHTPIRIMFLHNAHLGCNASLYSVLSDFISLHILFDFLPYYMHSESYRDLTFSSMVSISKDQRFMHDLIILQSIFWTIQVACQKWFLLITYDVAQPYDAPPPHLLFFLFFYRCTMVSRAEEAHIFLPRSLSV